jgi:hypothetical protein
MESHKFTTIATACRKRCHQSHGWHDQPDTSTNTCTNTWTNACTNTWSTCTNACTNTWTNTSTWT